MRSLKLRINKSSQIIPCWNISKDTSPHPYPAKDKRKIRSLWQCHSNSELFGRGIFPL